MKILIFLFLMTAAAFSDWPKTNYWVRTKTAVYTHIQVVGLDSEHLQISSDQGSALISWVYVNTTLQKQLGVSPEMGAEQEKEALKTAAGVQLLSGKVTAVLRDGVLIYDRAEDRSIVISGLTGRAEDDVVIVCAYPDGIYENKITGSSLRRFKIVDSENPEKPSLKALRALNKTLSPPSPR